MFPESPVVNIFVHDWGVIRGVDREKEMENEAKGRGISDKEKKCRSQEWGLHIRKRLLERQVSLCIYACLHHGIYEFIHLIYKLQLNISV